MKKGKNDTNTGVVLVPPAEGFLAIGTQSQIPLFARITAQIELARDQIDIVLAQKATDLAIKEAGDDLHKYIVGVLVNEVEILTTVLASSAKEERESKLDLLLKNFTRAQELILKYFVEFKKDFDFYKELNFEMMIINLVKAFVAIANVSDFSFEAKSKSEFGVASDFVLPLMSLIKNPMTRDRFEELMWQCVLSEEKSNLVGNVFDTNLITGRNFEHISAPENDPDIAFPTTVSNLVLGFIANPIYQNESQKMKALSDIWEISKLNDAIIKYCESLPERRYKSHELFNKDLNELLYDLLDQVIEGKHKNLDKVLKKILDPCLNIEADEE